MKPIESGFAQMGARVKVREIPSRWTQGDRSWISPQDYSLDIQRDGKGEFFELRVPSHLSETLDVTVMQSEPKQRHLLLFVRKPGDKPQLDRFLCGQDERLLKSDPSAARWGWRMMRRDMGVYARGAVSHADHANITLPFWHRVMMNTETETDTMRNVAFID
jgi:hypothetical protein